jgi:hypothetical protein
MIAVRVCISIMITVYVFVVLGFLQTYVVEFQQQQQSSSSFQSTNSHNCSSSSNNVNKTDSDANNDYYEESSSSSSPPQNNTGTNRTSPRPLTLPKDVLLPPGFQISSPDSMENTRDGVYDDYDDPGKDHDIFKTSDSNDEEKTWQSHQQEFAAALAQL